MTEDELNLYQRDAAALILAALVTGRVVKVPPPPPPDGASALLIEERQRERKDWETARNLERMRLAEEAFALAGALAAEATLWAPPAEADGTPLDARALDPSCTHGRKFTEDCPECRAENAGKGGAGAASAGNSDNSG